MDITNSNLEKVSNAVKEDPKYGPEQDLITSCIKLHPANDDINWIAFKIGLIDATHSTHISTHKSKISVVELANVIKNIKDIDKRIEKGDPEVVNEIAKANGKINLLAFASKYCCCHNRNYYGHDDYAIFDSVVKTYLPKYFGNEITSYQIEKWRLTYQYEKFNSYISKKLKELKITVSSPKRKLDWFIWYRNR